MKKTVRLVDFQNQSRASGQNGYTKSMSKCFTYVLLFDFGDFQIPVNELVTAKVRFPPAPPSNSLEENDYILQIK